MQTWDVMGTIHYDPHRDNNVLYIGQVIVSSIYFLSQSHALISRCRSSVNCTCHQKARVLYTKLALTKTTGVFLSTIRCRRPMIRSFQLYCQMWWACLNRWRALSGDDYICDCCESQCITSKSKRAMLEGKQCVLVYIIADESVPCKVCLFNEIATFMYNKWSTRIVLHTGGKMFNVIMLSYFPSVFLIL